MRFEAIENFYYAGRKYKRGEQFDALNEKDAITLRMCWKDIKEVKTKPKPLTTQNAQTLVTPENLQAPPEQAAIKADEPKPDPLQARRRRYPHRAMRADE